VAFPAFIAAKLAPMLIGVTAQALPVQSQIGALLRSAILDTAHNNGIPDVFELMACLALQGVMLSFEAIPCTSVVKVLWTGWPLDRRMVMPLMFKMTNKTVLTLCLRRSMKPFVGCNTRLEIGMTHKAFASVNFVADAVTVYAIFDSVKTRVGGGKLARRELGPERARREKAADQNCQHCFQKGH